MNLSYDDIREDENYSIGFDNGRASMQKAYRKLFNAARYFLQVYEEHNGEQDKTPGNDFYWNLKNIVNKPTGPKN